MPLAFVGCIQKFGNTIAAGADIYPPASGTLCKPKKEVILK